LNVCAPCSLKSQLVRYIYQTIRYIIQHCLHVQIRLGSKSVKEYGSVEEVTCGGNALRFYAAVRLRLSRMRLIKTEDKVSS